MGQWWRSCRRVAVTAAALCCLAAPSAGAVVAEDETFGDWIVKCQTPPGATEHVCAITQQQVTKEQRRKILLVTVGFFGKGKKPVAIMIVPLGVFLPAGLTLEVPGMKPTRIVFDLCVRAGCRAALGLDAATIAAMKRADKGKVTIKDSRRRDVTVPISFNGFTAGFDALAK